MTLVSSLITDAYRESNMLSLGKAPTAPQTTEALRLFNQLVESLYGGRAGESLADWPLGTYDRDPEDAEFLLPYTDERLRQPPINFRLVATNLVPLSIDFSIQPQDGSRMALVDPFSRLSVAPVTLNGNGRTIDGAESVLCNVDGSFIEWFYRADLGGWKKLTGLIETDENPFPAKFDIMFSILLAMRLNPRYGRTLDPQSVEALKLNQREFVARYLQSQPLEIDDSISWPFMSRQGYDTQRAFSSQRGFNRGNYWE